jgi:hypothetical protein
VVGLCCIFQRGEEPGVAADLSESMPKLNEGGDAGTCQGSPPALPALDGVCVDADVLGQTFLAQAGGLTKAVPIFA